MSKYKYQLHLHTYPCSKCGAMTPEELCRALFENGYQGAVITNHFYHGNSGIDRSERTSWNEFVKAYENDYLECVEQAKKYDLDIIFSVEEGLGDGVEILCYGVTPKILYDNPALRNCSPEECLKIMRENGVVLIQPHPFREASYISRPGPLPPTLIDGIEVYNAGNASEEMNKKAMALAEANPHLIRTSSADAHSSDRVGYGGIMVKERIKSTEDLVRILKSGDYGMIFPPKEN